ncbi:cytochrome P450 [Streptomyces sp. NPDC101181]|uniref:cytochrome P450 n=1 Tax=Streptomyces sp. NPDC101181 TaxID=3366125 RepID=UPI0038166495
MPADRSEALPAARRPHRRTGGRPGLLTPGASTDPHRLRLYRALRTDHPLGYDPGLAAWVLSRYTDVAAALTDPRFTGYPHDASPRGRGPAPLGVCRGTAGCAPPSDGGGTPDPGTAAAVERAAYVLARRIAGRDGADLVAEFCRWLPAGAAAVAVRRSHPAPGALSRHRRPAEAAGECAGHTALREKALASFLANMLDDPDLLAAARDGARELLVRAWAETLRRDPPVQIVLRRTRTEVSLSGGTLPAGAPVACLIGAAGRDPARFAAPDRFDPLRADADPLLTGPVGCPAAVLGRLEAAYGLRALLTAMPDIRWADGFRPVAGGLLTRGPRALLVRAR